jgi:4-amino-4-deoxy-L-arabinose transferase-like glycosyltransferase
LSTPADDNGTNKSHTPANTARSANLTRTISQPIIFDGTATPVKTALFIIICAAWILPGLIGHDPWKEDAGAFGAVYSMLTHSQGHPWLMPTIAGVPSFDYPPLYHWVSAILAWLLSPFMALHDGARLASGFFMVLTLYYLHKTANRLLDDRAGRIAVLLLIGSIGLWLRAHEANPELAGMAGFSIALYGMTRIRSETRKGGVTTGVGAGIMALSVGVVPALVVPVSLIALLTFVSDWRNRDFRRGILIAFAVMLPLMLIYPLVVWLFAPSVASDPRWMNDVVLNAPLLSAEGRRSMSPTYWLQNLPWFALPSLPFALWLWWKDRSKLRERIELALPLVAFVTIFFSLSLTREGRDSVGLAMLLPLALAGAGALDRLPRDVARIMDWFGLVLFGFVVFLLWTLWASVLTGLPRNFARWASNQAPGFELTFGWFTFTLALALTLVWLYAVIRAHRNNRRAVVNWAAGITICWVLINLLGLPGIDHVRSYRNVANAVAANVKKENVANSATPACVITVDLGDAQRSALTYFGKLNVIRKEDLPKSNTAKTECNWLIAQGSAEKNNLRMPDVGKNWKQVWEGARPGETLEKLRLYRRM